MNVTETREIENVEREHLTTITVSLKTAEIIRRLAGRLQSLTGETVTQRMIIDAAIFAYLKKIEENEI